MDELKAEILAVLKLSPISKIDKVTTIRADHAHVAERYELQLVDDVEEKISAAPGRRESGLGDPGYRAQSSGGRDATSPKEQASLKSQKPSEWELARCSVSSGQWSETPQRPEARQPGKAVLKCH
jgi:hypothetical protein